MVTSAVPTIRVDMCSNVSLSGAGAVHSASQCKVLLREPLAKTNAHPCSEREVASSARVHLVANGAVWLSALMPPGPPRRSEDHFTHYPQASWRNAYTVGCPWPG
eukprot:9471018-Pyramimonas_sp.AAC.1